MNHQCQGRRQKLSRNRSWRPPACRWTRSLVQGRRRLESRLGSWPRETRRWRRRVRGAVEFLKLVRWSLSARDAPTVITPPVGLTIGSTARSRGARGRAASRLPTFNALKLVPPLAGVQASRKPSSVPRGPRDPRGDDHLSRAPVTRRLKRPHPKAQASSRRMSRGHLAFLFGLAPGGVYPSSRSPGCR